jgi:hypothetical protein
MQDLQKNLVKIFKENKKNIKKQMVVRDLIAILDSLQELGIKDVEFLKDFKKVTSATLHKIGTH